MDTAVRMDDITPDMDWEKFWAFKALLDEYGIKPLIGVVPDNRDANLRRGELCPEFWELTAGLQREGWTVAMHGFRHRYATDKGGLFPLNRFSEFAGLPYERQRGMLEEGRRLLAERGIHTSLFMAPAHSYDNNTLRALRDTGFTAVTDGFGSRPYRWRGLTFYPIAFRLEGSLKRRRGTTTMVVHANTIEEKDMERYREIFARHRMISYSEYLDRTPVERRLPARLWEYGLACLKRRLVSLRGGAR